MNKKSICKEQIIFYTMGVLFVLLIISLIGLRMFVFFKYANTPIKDIPAWAYWVMQDNSKGGNNNG